MLATAWPVNGQACIEDVRALTDEALGITHLNRITPDGLGYAGEGILGADRVTFFWSLETGLRTTPFDPSTQRGHVIGTSKTGAFAIIGDVSNWRRWDTESGTIRTLDLPDEVSTMTLVRVTTSGEVYASGYNADERESYPWRWTEETGFVRLRDDPLILSGVSHDGGVRIGRSLQPYIWRSSSGDWAVMEGFPNEEDLVVVPNALSGNGAYATGNYQYPVDDAGNFFRAAFRWHDGAAEAMPGAGENVLDAGMSITADGAVIADQRAPTDNEQRQVMWTSGTTQSVYDAVVEAGLDPDLIPHALAMQPDGRCDCRIGISDDGKTLHSALLRAVRLNGGCASGLRGLFSPALYPGGTQVYLPWIASGVEGEVTVEFSSDGENYELIDAAPAYPKGDVVGKSNQEGGYIQWTVPQINTTNAHLRFSAAGAEDIIGPFTVQSACPTPATYEWRAEGAFFGTAGNWDPAGPPGEGDLARFNRDTFVPVLLSESATIGAMEILAGQVSVDTEGSALNLTGDNSCVPNLLVENGAELRVKHGNVFARKARISAGTVELTDAAGLLTDRLTLGESGSAAVTIDGPGALRVDLLLQAALSPDSEVEVTVNGTSTDSTFVLLPLRTEVGVRGTASLTVSGRAKIVGPLLIDPDDQPLEMVVGLNPGSEGTVTLSGPDLRIFLPSDDADRITSLTVGDAGSGTFHLADGVIVLLDTVTVANTGSGKLRVDSTSGLQIDGRLRMGVAVGSEAVLEIDGADAVDGVGAGMLLAGEADIGVGGTATVHLLGQSYIQSATSSPEFNPEEERTIRLGSAATGEGHLIAAGPSAVLSLRHATLVLGDIGKGDLQATGGAEIDVGNLWIGKGSTGFGSAYAGGAGTTVVSNRLAVGTGAFGLLQVADDAFVQTDLIWIGANGQVEGDVLALGAYTPPGKAGAQSHGIAADTLILNDGAVVTVDTLAFGDGAVLGGNGTLAADFTNRGALAPGDSADAGAGTGRFTVAADYAQTTDGVLEIDLAGLSPGSGHDQLQVSGSASLDGTLRLALIGGYVPTSGDAYEIVTASNIGGQFAAIEPPEGVEVTLTYEATRVVATVGDVTVHVDDPDEAMPISFVLEANFPNPFNPQTTIRYGLPEMSTVRLTVYDALGRRVAVLVDGVRPAGHHEVTFDAAGLPSGAYLYQLDAGRFREVRRMLLVK